MRKKYYIVEVNEIDEVDDSNTRDDSNKNDQNKNKYCCTVILILLATIGISGLLLPWATFIKSYSLTKDRLVNGNYKLYDSFTNLNEGTTIEEELNIFRITSIIGSALGTIMFLIFLPICVSKCECILGRTHARIAFIINACFIIFEVVHFLLLLFFNNKLEEVTIYSDVVTDMRNISLASAILASFEFYPFYNFLC